MIRDLSKSFTLNGRRLDVLRGIDLKIRGGEAIAIVGPSGCGKTTLLRVLAGLEEPDRGDVLIDGAPVHGIGNQRSVIFQEPRLLPWLTVTQNVAFGLEVRGIDPAQAADKARHFIRLVGLSGFEEAYPRQLSGGMAQRVGIARALTVQPEILLLDEPLGALDATTKLTMQEELFRIWRDEKVTMVLVTHDLEEAIFLADRVPVMSKDSGTPPRLIDLHLPRPQDRSKPEFVALKGAADGRVRPAMKVWPVSSSVRSAAVQLPDPECFFSRGAPAGKIHPSAPWTMEWTAICNPIL